MEYEQGQWIMRGLAASDPRRLRNLEDLIAAVDRMGFLPLFCNSVPGFSVEELTWPGDWWTDDERRDPWAWRMTAARSGRVAYGKFFDKKAGFLSLAWLPVFANWRRDGYDFDARYDDAMAPLRQKKIMDVFESREDCMSFELKALAGFGPGGEKNYEGTVTALQMQTYLVMRDFRCRKNRYGEDYGWPIAVYAPPEKLWGYEAVTACYGEAPEASRERVFARMRELYPQATDRQIKTILR